MSVLEVKQLHVSFTRVSIILIFVALSSFISRNDHGEHRRKQKYLFLFLEQKIYCGNKTQMAIIVFHFYYTVVNYTSNNIMTSIWHSKTWTHDCRTKNLQGYLWIPANKVLIGWAGVLFYLIFFNFDIRLYFYQLDEVMCTWNL